MATQKVLEQNPSKQGLKHSRTPTSEAGSEVLEQNPSKQGLKPVFPKSTTTLSNGVLEQNPSKQGLKHRIASVVDSVARVF